MNKHDFSGRDWSDEDLLELALSDSANENSPVEEVAVDDSAAAMSFSALRCDLDRLRAALSDEQVLGQGPGVDDNRRRLVTRVLKRTTREDPSWRGDVVLFSRFCRERLRSSMVLRIAAASLLVHLAAAPAVLAFLILRQPSIDPGFKTGFEPPVESPYAEDPVEETPLIRFLGPQDELPVPELDFEGLDD